MDKNKSGQKGEVGNVTPLVQPQMSSLAYDGKLMSLEIVGWTEGSTYLVLFPDDTDWGCWPKSLLVVEISRKVMPAVSRSAGKAGPKKAQSEESRILRQGRMEWFTSVDAWSRVWSWRQYPTPRLPRGIVWSTGCHGVGGQYRKHLFRPAQ